GTGRSSRTFWARLGGRELPRGIDRRTKLVREDEPVSVALELLGDLPVPILEVVDQSLGASRHVKALPLRCLGVGGWVRGDATGGEKEARDDGRHPRAGRIQSSIASHH